MSLEQAIQNLADAIKGFTEFSASQVMTIGVDTGESIPAKIAETKATPTKAKTKAAPVKAAPEPGPEDDDLDEEPTEDAEDAPSAEDYVVALQATHRRLIAIATDKGEALPVEWSKKQLAKVTGGLKKDEVDPSDYAAFIAGFKELK